MLCRYKGFHEYAKSAGMDVGAPVGLDVMIDGTVPTGKKRLMVSLLIKINKFLFVFWLHLFLVKYNTGSGLSSSAAFVCSSTIAIMAALNVNLPKVF